MDISSLPRLDGLSTFYSERFEVFKACWNRQKICEWISENFNEAITSKLMNKNVEDGKLSVLGIGSGDGQIEVKMLLQLTKKFRFIECTVVEPSVERMACYKELVKDLKDALNGVTFDWRQQTLQEFSKTNSAGSMKFNFVSAIHILYYVPRENLDYYIDAVTGWTNGKILIMQTAEKSIFGQIEKEFSSALSAFPPFILGNTIADSLESFRISFETSVLPCELDVTVCFDNDSRDGKFLLEFLLQLAGWVDDGPPELLKMVKDFLRSESISRNGRLYVTSPSQIIIT